MRGSKYHSKWKANMAKCSKYHAKCKVSMPKCSTYHAKWQVLVPTCCKYKANGTRKESQKNPKSEAKKNPKTMLHHWKPNFALFRRDWIPNVRRKWYANLEQATHWAWNEVPASLSANPPGSDPVVFVNRSMKLICMICSWRCFFGYKGKEGSFFTPRVSHSDQHDQHKNKNMPFLALNTIQILMSIPSGSARGQSPPRGTTAASCGHDQLFGPRAKSGWDRPKSCTGSETLLLTCKNHPMPSGINVPSGWIGGWFSWCFMRIKAP